MVTTTVIDAFEFSDLASSFGVRSAPLTVIDGGLTLPGVIPSATLVDHLLERGGTKHLADMFRSLIEVGRHREAARLTVSGEAVPVFLEIWKDSTLAERIGLMIVAEEALAGEPRALDSIVHDLVALLGSNDASLRGDSVDLLGRIGDPVVVDPINQLRNDPNPHVAEIATEVLEELSLRDGSRFPER